MAENVGSVSIDLILDREQFDADLAALAEEGPINLDFRSGLDLRQMERDWSGMKRRSVDAELNFDSRAMDLRIQEITRDRHINFIAKADIADAKNTLASLGSLNRTIDISVRALSSKALNLPNTALVVSVDDRALTALNAHLSLKERHFNQVRSLFSGSPLSPKGDSSGMDLLDGSIDRAARSYDRFKRNASTVVTIPVDAEQIDDAAEKLREFKSDVREAEANIRLSSSINVDTNGLRSAFKDGANSIERSVGGLNKGFSNLSIPRISGGGGSLPNPLKFAANITSTVIGGALTQIGMDFSKQLSSSFMDGLSSGLSPIFGSSSLVGKKIGNVTSQFLAKTLAPVVPFVREYISEEEATTESAAQRGTARKKQQAKIKLAENQTKVERQFVQENLPQIQQFAGQIKQKQGIYDAGKSALDQEVQAAIDRKTVNDRNSITQLTQARAQLIEAPAKAGSRDQLPQLTQRQGEIQRQIKKTTDTKQKTALFSEFAANEQSILEITSPEKAKQAKIASYGQKITQAADRVSTTSQDVKDRYAPDYKQFDVMGKKIETDRAALGKMTIGLNAAPMQTGVFGAGSGTREQIATKAEDIAQMKQEYARLSGILEKYVKANGQKIQNKYKQTIANLNSEISVLEGQLTGSLVNGEKTVESESIEKQLSIKKAEVKMAKKGAIAAPTAARSAVAPQVKELENLGSSIKDEEKALSRMKASAARPAVENLGVQSVASVEARKQAEVAKFTRENPKEYVELAKTVMGKEFNTQSLPKLEVMSQKEYEKSTSEASYSPSKNRIKVSPSIASELTSGQVLSPSVSRTVAEELGHAVDTGYGSTEGMKAFKSGRVYGKAAVPTASEYQAIAPDLGRYGSAVREIELSGKTRALRGSKEYQESRGLTARQTRGSEELTAIATAESVIDSSKAKIQSLSDLSTKFGVDLTKTIDILSSHIATAETKVASLKEQSLQSIADPSVAPIDRTELGKVAQTLGIVQGGIQNKLAPLQQLEVARSIELPNLQDSKYETSVLSVANKSLKKSGLANSGEDVKGISAEIKAIESESKKLASKIGKLTPENAAQEYPELSKQALSLVARKAKVSESIEATRKTTEGSSPGVYDRAKGTVDKQIERKEQMAQVAQSVKQKAAGIAGAVGGAVFNPDRNIDINTEQIKAGVQVAGKSLYFGGLAIAKTMDAINTGFSVLAQSNPGQKVLGATKEASTALLHVAKTSYGLAKGVENAALTIIPFGQTAKSGIKNIGLPMLAANVAASHIPGGQMLLEGAGNLANMALGPLAHGGVSAMAQGAGSAVGGIFPQFGGLGAQVASGVSGLIEGGLGSAISPAIEGAVALITGKLVMNTAGSAVAQLPGVAEITGTKAIAPSPSRALPQSKTMALPAAEPQLQDLTDKQLRAYAKTQGLAFGKKVKKEDVITRIEQTTPGDLGSLASTIGGQFNRKGQAIGVDPSQEKGLIAQLRTKEKQIHELHAQVRKALGKDRVVLAEQLLHESKVFADQLKSANQQPMTGGAAQTIGQMYGRVESFTRHAEGNTEARNNNRAAINQTLNNPLGIRTIDVQAQPQSQRLYRASESRLGFVDNLRGMVGGLFGRTPKVNADRDAMAQSNFKKLYAEVAISNGSKNPEANIPALEIGKDNNYDAQSNTVTVTKQAYRELSQSIGRLRAGKLKPVVHEIQHSQQLDSGNRSIAEAAYGSGDFKPKLESPVFDRKTQKMVDRSVAMGGGGDAVRKLENDAYAKEAQTAALVDRLKRKNTIDNFESNFDSQSGSIGDLGSPIPNIKSKLFGRLNRSKPIAPPKLDNTGIDSTKAGVGFDSASSKFDEAERRILQEPEQLRYGLFDKLIGNFGEARIQRRKSTLPKGFKPKTSEDSNALASDAIAGFDNSAARFDQIGDSINLKYKAHLNGEQPKQELNILGQLFGKTMIDPFGEAVNGAKKLGALLEPIKGKLLSFAAPIAFGALLAALPVLKQLADQAIQAAIAADRVKTALTFSTGSKSGGDKAFEYSSNVASDLGVDRKSAIEGYSKLRASSKGKISEAQSNDVFEGILSASTTLGLSGDDQNGIMLALGQSLSKGTLQAEEIRGQIGERLPGAFAIAARSMNMSEAQLGKAMESGSVSAEKFMPAFGQQLKKEYGPGAKDASQNLQSSMFRLEGAQTKVAESVGSSLAVPVKLGTDGAIAGLNLLLQYGDKLIILLGMNLAGAALKAAGSFIAYNGGLMAMGTSALSAVGGISGIMGALTKLATVIAPMLAKFALLNAAIEIGKGIFSAFTPDDMGQRFEAQAGKIKQSLKEIEERGKNAQKSANMDAPSKGIDIGAATFGLSSMVGINKGDDLVKGVNSNSVVDAILSFTPVFSSAKQINEANGGKGFATMQEADFTRTRVKLADEQGAQIYKATGGVFDKFPELAMAAKTSQTEQISIDTKQAEKARLLSSSSPDKARIGVIDTEIKAASERRDSSNQGMIEQRAVIEGTLEAVKSQKIGVEKDSNYTAEQKSQLIGDLNAQQKQLEIAKKVLDDIDKKAGGTTDIMSKFNVALSEMAAKIEEASAIAKNAFNKSEVERLTQRKGDRKTDEFASQTGAVKQSENEKTRADSELSGTRKAIGEVDAMLVDPTVAREISKIAINGKSVDGETSAQQLEQAKAGRTDKEKGQIDKLIARRKAVDGLPELEKNSLEAEDKVFNSKSSLALEKLDRGSANKDNILKAQEGKLNFDLIKAQKKGGMGENDVNIAKAEIGKASADRQVSNINQNINDVDKLFKEGTISKEEHTKRSAALRNSLVDATVKAAQAELDIEKAKNKKILDDHETTVRRRAVERQEATGAKTIGLIKQQMGNKINESDVEIKKAEIQKESADGEAADVRKQMGEIDQLRKQGVLSEDEYVKKKLELRSKLVDADVKAAEAALAIEKAKNQKILNEWARTIKEREVVSQRKEGRDTVALIKGQMGNKMSDEDVAVRKAEIQGESSQAAVSNLEKQMSEVADLKNRGVITEEDYKKRILDIESNLIGARTRAAEATLAIEQAKNRKLVAEFDAMQKRRESAISDEQSKGTTGIKRSQLDGKGLIGEGGQSEAIKIDIVATEKRVALAKQAVNKDVELRRDGKISEKDYNDRISSNKGKLRGEEEKLVNLLIQQRQGIYQKEHDAFNRANTQIIRGLEERKQRSEMASRMDGAKQGVLESVVGLAKAKSDNAVSDVELRQAGTKGDGGKTAAMVRLASLGEIQRAEMLILDLKEKQAQASLRQSMIESQIAYGKQQIVVSESKRKLKDALLTGDRNAIANASEDLTGQQQILGLEGEKMGALQTQNKLSMQKLGIDRKTALVGMDTERKRAKTAVVNAGGSLRDFGGRDVGPAPFGPNRFARNETGINLNNILNPLGETNKPTMPILQKLDLTGGPNGDRTIDFSTNTIDKAGLASKSIDRAATQAIGITTIDDRNIIAAIDRLGSKLDKFPSSNGNAQRQPGYSDFLTADTNAKFARS